HTPVRITHTDTHTPVRITHTHTLTRTHTHPPAQSGAFSISNTSVIKWKGGMKSRRGENERESVHTSLDHSARRAAALCPAAGHQSIANQGCTEGPGENREL